MKNFTLLLFLILLNKSYSQGTYFDYLDYSSEWRNYGGGWNGIFFYEDYSTSYFDGDTIINGTYYYKKYTLSNTNLFSNPTFQIYLYGPTYIREDSTKNMYQYSLITNSETSIFDSQAILDSTIGDIFPATGAICPIEYIDYINLGARPLKLIRGMTYQPSGYLEGIGAVGSTCALGVEGSGNLVCYRNATDVLQFGTLNCNDTTLFPSALRINSIKKNKIELNVYPNPTQSTITINNLEYKFNTVQIYSAIGELVLEKSIQSESETIDLSNLSNGVYHLILKDDFEYVSKKIIKL